MSNTDKKVSKLSAEDREKVKQIDSMLTGVNIDAENENAILSSMDTHQKIYMDIDFLKDFQIARYLASFYTKQSGPEKYEMFLEQARTLYLERTTYDFKFADIEPAELKDDMAFKIAPVTFFFVLWLKAWLARVRNHNTVTGATKDPSVTLNVFPYDLSHDSCVQIQYALAEMYGLFDVEIINKDPASIPGVEWGKNDAIFIWRYNKFFSAYGVGDMLQGHRLASVSIYAPKLSDALDAKLEDFDKEAAIVQLFTKFQFLDKRLTSPVMELGNGEETNG